MRGAGGGGGGVAPPHGPLDADGQLSGASLARLAAMGLSEGQALAALYRGEDVLAGPPAGAVAAIEAAVAAQVHAMPPHNAGVLGFAPVRPRPRKVPVLPLELPEPASARRRGLRLVS